MPTREQLIAERLDALIEVLAADEALTDKEARLLKSTRDFQESPELAKGFRERRE